MSEFTTTTNTPEATTDLGMRLGRSFDAGICVALIGPLGAGKTQFVRGVATGLEVPRDVTVNSPTFVIVNEYPGRFHVFHLDAYRLNSPDELTAIGFDEMLASAAIVLVEWADRVTSALPTDHLRATFEHVGETVRRINFRALGPHSQQTLDALTQS